MLLEKGWECLKDLASWKLWQGDTKRLSTADRSVVGVFQDFQGKSKTFKDHISQKRSLSTADSVPAE